MIVFVAESISKKIEEHINKNHYVIKVKRTNKTYKAISHHPDIQLLPIENQLFIDRSCYDILGIEDQLVLKEHGNCYCIDSELGVRYPYSVLFNGKYKSNQFIHNLKYSEPTMLQIIRKFGIDCYHVEQGYTGCSLLYLGNKAGITSDQGLAKSLIKEGFDILLIQSGYIRLEGFDYGFIGGASGVIEDIVYFNGHISGHPDYKAIDSFVQQKGFKIIEDITMELVDCGSILSLK